VKQIRRRIYFCRGASGRLSSCRQNAPVGQQKRCGVIRPHPGQARHCCPIPGCRIPQLAFVCWIGRSGIRTLSASASTRHQDCAVRKQCSVVKFASSRQHRSSVTPSGTRAVQVDDLCGFRWISGAIGTVKSAWASAYDQYLPVIIHHCRSPIASPIVAIGD
jgi:hypothetical protein